MRRVSPRRASGTGVFALLLGLALLLPTAVAADGSIEITDIRVRDSALELDFLFDGGLSGKVLGTIERGLPASVSYEIELWRSRSSWFDKLEASRFLSYRVSYDIIENRYECSSGLRVRQFDSLEGLEGTLLRQTGIQVADLADLDGGKSYFFSIRAKVVPVELKQVREMEAWLEGKIPGDEGSGDGGAGAILGVPEKLFGFLAGLTGFGDEEIETKSISFVPEGLE